MLINDIFSFVTIKIKNILLSNNLLGDKLAKWNSGRYKKIIKDIVVFVIIEIKDQYIQDKRIISDNYKEVNGRDPDWSSWEVVGNPGKVDVTLKNISNYYLIK